MKPFILATFPSGHVYEIPTAAIAEDRTAYFALQDPSRTREQHHAETLARFESEFEIFEWMKESMRWSEIKAARLVGFRPADLAGTWADAELQTADGQAMPDIANLKDGAITAPIELAVAQAAAEQAPCLIFPFASPGGAIRSVAAVVVGEPDVTGAYMAALIKFDEFMRGQLEAARAAAH